MRPKNTLAELEIGTQLDITMLSHLRKLFCCFEIGLNLSFEIVTILQGEPKFLQTIFQRLGPTLDSLFVEKFHLVDGQLWQAEGCSQDLYLILCPSFHSPK